VSAGLGGVTTATARLIFDASSVQSGVRQANQALGSLYEVVRDNWWGIRNVGIAFTAAAGVITAGLAKSVQAAAAYEQGMAGVARTTFDNTKSLEENAAAAEALGEQLREVARTRPVDLNTILGLAEQAGALGIAQKDVAEFTGTITDLIATTNLTADSAKELARIAGVFGLAATEYKNLGAAVFEAGRSTAATETEILNMTKRLGPAGKAAGLTAAQVVALSAATLSLGPRAEAGASALQAVLGKMAQNIAGVSKNSEEKLGAMANVAGVTADEFSRLFQADPGDALLKFIEGLGKQSGNVVAVNKSLREAGIIEVRQIQALQALAAGTRNSANENVNLANTFALTNKAYVEGTAVTDAAKRQYQTLTNQMKILKNNVNDVFISFGTLYLPVVKDAVGITQSLVVGLDNLPAPMRTVIAVLAAAGAGVLGLAGGFLLLGPRIILAKDAFEKLVTTMRVAATTQIVMNSANQGIAATSLKAALAAGFNAKAQNQLAAANATSAAAATANAEATAAEAAVMQLQARLVLELRAAQTSILAGKAEEAALRTANARVLASEIVLQRQAATAAAANAAAQGAAATQLGKARGAAVALGVGLRAALSPLGLLVIGLTAVVAALVIFGRETEKAKSQTEQYSAVSSEMVNALNMEAQGHAGRVKALIAEQLAMNGSIAIAERYGFTTQQLYAVITGANQAMTTSFIDALSAAYRQGDKDARTLAETVAGLARAYAASRRAAQDQAKANKALGVSNDEATKSADRLTAAQKKVDDQLNAQAQAAIDLAAAQLSLVSAGFSVADAQDKYADALERVRNKAKYVQEAQDALTRSQLDQRKAAKDVADAQKALSTARSRQAKDVAQKERDVSRAVLDQANAVQKQKDAQKELDKLKTGATVDELADATNKLANANTKLKKSRQTQSDAKWYLDYLKREGASLRDLQDAQLTLEESNNDVNDSTQDQKKAQGDLNKLQDGASAEDLAEAERKLADAKLDVVDATQEVIDKENELTTARKDKNNDTYYKEASDDLIDARLGLREATNKLKDAEQNLKDVRSGKDDQRDLARAAFDLEQAYYNQAKAMVEVKKQTALMNGKTFDARQEALALAEALQIVGDAAGGPLGQKLKALGAMIRTGIPSKKKVTISADTSQTDQTFGPDGPFGPGGTYDQRLDEFQEKSKSKIDAILEYISKNPGAIGAALAGALLAILAIALAPAELGVIATAAIIGLSAALAGLLYSYLPESIRKPIDEAFRKMGDWAGDAWQGALSYKWSELPGKIEDWFKTDVPKIEASVDAWWGRVGNACWNGLVTGLTTVWNLPSVVSGLVASGAASIATSVGSVLLDATEPAWRGFVNGINSAWLLADAVSKWLKDKKQGAIDLLNSMMSNASGDMWGSFTKAMLLKWDFIGALSGRIASWIIGIPGAVARAGSSMASSIWDSFSSKFKETFGINLEPLIRTALSGVGRIAGDAMSGVGTSLKIPINATLGALNAAFDAIAGISFNVPNIPGLPGGGSHIGFPHFHVNYLAKGGILNGPTALNVAGEAGREAVIPLDELYRMLEPIADVARELSRQNDLLTTMVATTGTVGAVGSDGATTINNNYDIDVNAETDADPFAVASEIAWAVRS
jgi:TP901 family phage tail tape measure protein